MVKYKKHSVRKRQKKLTKLCAEVLVSRANERMDIGDRLQAINKPFYCNNRFLKFKKGNLCSRNDVSNS